MKDIRLTKVSGSWRVSVTDGTWDWVEDGAQAAQHSLIRLMFFKASSTTPGHYTLNNKLPHKTNSGTDWFGIILRADKSQAEKEFEIRRRLLGTPGIDSIHKFQMTMSGNTMAITGEGKTAWGTVDMSQEFELL